MMRCLECGRRHRGEHCCAPRGSQGRLGSRERRESSRGTRRAPARPPTLHGYAIGEPLGAGGEAAVFAAERIADGATVAIKVTTGRSPGARENLRHERDILRAIGPPAVPDVYEFRTQGGGEACLVLERLTGYTLAQVLDGEAGPVPAWKLPPVALAVLDALAMVHAAGWVHCDLKPENVFLEPIPGCAAPEVGGERPMRARLVDLGIARRIGARPGASDRDAVLGTAEYMAPEQCEPGPAISAATDVYALGVVFYEALTGRPPFFGQPELVRQAHTSQRPPRPSELGPVGAQTERVLLTCLAKDPSDRYPDIGSLRAALVDAFQTDEMTPLLRRPASVRRTVASAQRAMPCGLLLFTADQPALEVDRVVESFGGVLAHAAGTRFGAVFDHVATDNPVERAVLAAHALHRRGMCDRAVVDLAPVKIRQRKGGGVRYRTPAFLCDDSYPADTDPRGALITERALLAVPTLAVEPIGREQWYAAGDPNAESTPGTPPALHMPYCPLVGRHEEMQALLDSARAAFTAGQPGIATVTGEAAIGKTRLAEELMMELSSELDTHVVEVRAREPVGGASEQCLGELVRSISSLPADAPADAGRAVFTAQLGEPLASEVWPALALAVGWTTPNAPELSQYAAAPGALRAFQVRAIGLAIRAVASHEPLAVVLDDAHLADETTLDALEFAALSQPYELAESNPVSLWVCALAHPSWLAGRPTWGDRAAHHVTVSLSELSLADSTALCRALIEPVEAVPAAALAAIAEQSGGIPLFLVELVRGLKRDGVIRRQARGEGWYLATDELEPRPSLPLIQWLVERELAALPAELAAHASLAALLGDGFAWDAVAGVLEELERDGAANRFPLDGKAALRRLIRRNVIVLRGDGTLGFRHSVMRDALARRLPSAVRAQIHQAAYRYYDARGEPGELGHRAHHAARSGLADEACRLHVALAEEAHRRHAYVEAERCYSRALELLSAASDAPPATDADDGHATDADDGHATDADDGHAREWRRMICYRGRGVMRYRTGRYGDALADLRHARAIAARLGEAEREIEILLDEATALDWMQEYQHAASAVGHAVERALAAGLSGSESETGAALLAANPLAANPRAVNPLIGASIEMARGRSAWRFSRLPEACRLLEGCVRAAEPLGTAAYEVLIGALTTLGAACASLGRLDRSAEVFARAMQLAEEYGDPIQIAALCNARRLLAVLEGDRDRLVRDLRRALRIGRELGMSAIEYVVQVNLGEHLYQVGELAAAAPHAARGREMEQRYFGGQTRPSAALLEARMLAFTGDEHGLREALAALAAHQARARADADSEGVLAPDEQVLVDALGLASRESAPGEWDAICARAAERAVEPEVLELRGLWALRRGRPDEARRSLEAALAAAERVPTMLADRIREQLARLH